MKLSAFVLVFLYIINTVLSLPSKVSLINNILDYDEIVNINYSNIMDDTQLKHWLTDGINYVINTKYLNKNTSNIEDLNKIRENIYYEIMDEINKSEKMYKNNDLEIRSCVLVNK